MYIIIQKIQKSIFNKLRHYKRFFMWANRAFTTGEELGYVGKNAVIEWPIFIENPEGVIMEEYSKIRHYCKIINAPTEKVIIKRFSVVAAGCTIITNSHRSTVGIPQFILVASHVNDKSADVIIEEDVWIGANVTIMPGVTIGRGSVIGAGSIVTRNVPPYALAVGLPAKIVGKTFSLADVCKHEEELYSPKDRLSQEYLRDLFSNEYKDLRIYGCNNPLTAEEKARIDLIKKLTNFTN